jgi:hypothetical protein
MSLDREWLEDVFAIHAASETGVRWRMKHWKMKFDADDEYVELKFNRIVEEMLVKFTDMVEGTLYYRIEPQFPFVDGVWKSKGRLFAFQATTSISHPNPVHTFEKALRLLDIDTSSLQSIRPCIYYVMMPRSYDEAVAKKVSRSFFGKI